MPKQLPAQLQMPSSYNWRTSDEDEINRRRVRAQSEDFRVTNTNPEHPIFSNFKVSSGSGMNYAVEVRDIAKRQYACDCVDFRINGLGTCKHVEAVLLHLQARFKGLYKQASQTGSDRLDVIPDLAGGSIRLTGTWKTVPGPLRDWLLTGTPLENRIDELYSLMGFLNPSALGPLFRFNREYYELDDRGRPIGYRNLDRLHERIKPYMLRRRKADVETELPKRSDRNFFVRLSDEQQGEYDEHEGIVAKLGNLPGVGLSLSRNKTDSCVTWP
jgi:hypothetical protein